MLAESSLSLGEVDEATSDSAPKGTVTGQDPQAGVSVDPETAVNVTLSSGPEQISVPDLGAWAWRKRNKPSLGRVSSSGVRTRPRAIRSPWAR